jgi:hypothetical protein
MTKSAFLYYVFFMLVTSVVSYPVCVFLTATGGSVSLDSIHWAKAFQYWLLLPLPLFTILFLLLRYIILVLQKK